MTAIMEAEQLRLALAALEVTERLVNWMARRWKDEPCPECGGTATAEHVAGCELDAILGSFPPLVGYAKEPR